MKDEESGGGGWGVWGEVPVRSKWRESGGAGSISENKMGRIGGRGVSVRIRWGESVGKGSIS